MLSFPSLIFLRSSSKAKSNFATAVGFLHFKSLSFTLARFGAVFLSILSSFICFKSCPVEWGRVVKRWKVGLRCNKSAEVRRALVKRQRFFTLAYSTVLFVHSNRPFTVYKSCNHSKEARCAAFRRQAVRRHTSGGCLKHSTKKGVHSMLIWCSISVFFCSKPCSFLCSFEHIFEKNGLKPPFFLCSKK